jgi:uncharacterized protein involved in exopolysaccharide biosynthesis/Mrp family chromosome partitioning ATPase
MDQLVPHPEWRTLRPHPIQEEEEGPLPETPAVSLSFGEACYVLYRHKWKIILCSLAGLAGAAAIYTMSPNVYRSEAEIWVKYLEENQALGPGTTKSQDKPEVLRGEQVIGSEVRILTSLDLATKVAAKIGPEVILAKAGGGTNLEAAAQVISFGTGASVAPGSEVIAVTFEHPDRAIVRTVLTNLIEEYVKKHWEIHRALPDLEEYTREKDDAKRERRDAEQSLLNMQKTNRVFSLEAAKRSISERIAKYEDLLHDAQAELAARTGLQQSFPGLVPTNSAVAGNTNTLSVSEQEAYERTTKEYARIVAEIDQLRKKEQSFQSEFKPGSGMTAPLTLEIAKLERQKKEMEKKDISLIGSAAPGSDNGVSEQRKFAMLPFRIKALQEQLTEARKEEERYYELENPMSQLQREKDRANETFNYFDTQLERYKLDSGLAASRFSNIAHVEAPTPPKRVVVRLFKRMAMAAGGGIGLGIGLAILIEFFIDQSVKRPVELQRILSVPMYLTIPKQARGRWAWRLPRRSASSPISLEDSASQRALTFPAAVETDERLHPYFEALRDRVLNRFEALARKPKLVAVCGCTDGNGSTTTAAGLASALCEAGDLKVLLVDMKLGNGSLPSGQDNKKACTLLDALEGQKRQQGLIAPNLYRASARQSSDGQFLTSPTRFTTVVPRLNASDYDYIVFDLPPVDEVSITPRLAKHMDLTLLVVEGQETTRSVVKGAGELLLEFTPNVAMVLNNTEAKLPKWLQQIM